MKVSAYFLWQGHTRAVQRLFFFILVPAFVFTSGPSSAMTMEQCLQERILTARDNATVAQLRKECRACLEAETQDIPLIAEPPTSLDARIAALRELPANASLVVQAGRLQEFMQSLGSELRPHKANYILPYTYNPSPNSEPYGIDSGRIDNAEIKFQISLKYRLVDNIFGDAGDLFVAYTNQSYWQAYNKDASSPFREINHEPEAWLAFDTERELAGFRLRTLSLGINHQSNGRTQKLSRSWNRVFAEAVLERGDFWFSIRPWYRIPEKQKTSQDDPRGDDNPNMEKYFGYGELKAYYGWKGHGLTLMLRNNLRLDGNKGAMELGWIFPIHGGFKGYVQYFTGYGESLIDYDVPVSRIGVGFIFSPWR
jgi:phospholipase A1